jgi:hypothetical protein
MWRNLSYSYEPIIDLIHHIAVAEYLLANYDSLATFTTVAALAHHLFRLSLAADRQQERLSE